MNLVEYWNGINDLIFYGKTGTMRSNRSEELEISMLCLHLLQLSLVFINTLMLQQVLKKNKWKNNLILEDKKAITLLLTEHINLSGEFTLDFNKRLNVEYLLWDAA